LEELERRLKNVTI